MLQSYVKNVWFVLDILCAFPFGWIMIVVGVPIEKAGLYRLVKLVKLFRFFKHMETIWKILILAVFSSHDSQGPAALAQCRDK